MSPCLLSEHPWHVQISFFIQERVTFSWNCLLKEKSEYNTNLKDNIGLYIRDGVVKME